MVSFGAKLTEAIASKGNLCAGIDPHPALLEHWGLSDDLDGLKEFSERALAAFSGVAAMVKPQSAFFERHGSGGLAVLEGLLDDARSAGVLSLLDVKRGDIGSTMDAYADAYLADGSPFSPDAITVSPFLGFGSLQPAIDTAFESGRGVFVLCLTSNPEGAELQMARNQGLTVAGTIAHRAGAENRRAEVGGESLGPIGLVIGATVGRAVIESGIDLEAVNGPFLLPGTGAQGGDPAMLGELFGGVADRVLVSTARELLVAGPENVAVRSAAEAARDRAMSGLATR